MDFIRLENVSKFYSTGKNVALGIRKINLTFNIGEFVVITGASGSGKSTLLNVISGMDSYEEGIMYLNGEDTSYFGPKEYEEYRRNYITYIFQNYNLIDSYTVYQNVEMALVARGFNKKERQDKVNQVIKEVGLENRKRNKVTKLSGGEKQRVAIARALVSDAPIMVCDEITGNLDVNTSREIIDLLRKVCKGRLVLMVTHDPEEALKYASRCIRMFDGNVAEDKILNNNLDRVEERKQVKANKVITTGSMMATAMRNLFSTPRKLVLMMAIYLFAIFLVGYAFSITESNTSMSSNYNANFNNYYQERIVVQKEDKSAFTETDYNKLSSINGVKNLIKNDYIIDEYIALELNQDYYNGKIRSIKDIESKDLLLGRMPENENEVVIGCDEDAAAAVLNENISYNYSILSGFIPKNAIVCGVIKKNSYQMDVYLADSIIQSFILNSMCNKSSGSISFKDNDKTIEKLFFSTVDINVIQPTSIFISPTLEANSMIYVTYNNVNEITDKTTTDLVFSNNYTKKEIKNVKWTLYNQTSAKNILTTNKVENASLYQCQYQAYGNKDNPFFDSFIIISSDIASNLLNQEVYQVSLTVNDYNESINISNKIMKDNFNAYPLYNPNQTTIEIIQMILNIFLYITAVILIGFIYLISRLSLKNLMLSQKKDFLVMRSLGINGKDINKQIYFELFGLCFVCYLIYLIFVIVLSNIRVPDFLSSLVNMSVSKHILVLVAMIILSLLLGLNYSKNILKSTIVSKELE